MVTVSRPNSRIGPHAQVGFTYLWLLGAIALLGIGLLAVSEVWATTAKRQKMIELEWIGAQFTRAIGSYYYATPGSSKAYPTNLQDLIQDPRYATVRRHLRTLYLNPFSGKPDWQMILSADGRVRGVSAAVPGDGETTIRRFLYRPGVSDP